MNLSKMVIAFSVMALASSNVVGKEWHGIVPLKSTKDDVLKILKEIGSSKDPYEVEEGRVNILYARGPCEQGLPSDWGNWNVPAGTVINIFIYLKKEMRLSKSQLQEMKKFKWYTDDSGTTYYNNEVEGIQYSVSEGEEGGLVTSITYGPTKSDEHLLCKKDAPKIKY